MKRDFTIMNAQGRVNSQGQASTLNPGAPKKNFFYTFQYRGDQENSPNMVTGILQLFSFYVYAFLDTRDTL